jgi:DNA primase small subunit
LHLECQLKHGRSWVCENCLNEVKNETFKLIESFLVPDFGISKDDIKINFSGNRGYHLHIMDKRFYSLNSNERRQISDYITARGINLNIFFPNISEKRKQFKGPKPDDPGWGGKFARSVISYLNSDEKKLEKLNIDKKIAKKLIKNKAEIIMGITVGNWDKIDIPKKTEFWTNLLNNVAVAQTSMIDKNVTSGAEHLIRLPNSIHSDTALLAKQLPSVNSLEKFEPMKEAVLFKKGAIKVHVEKSEALSINDQTFGPYGKQDIELPTYAALYLLLKGVATLTD